MFTRLNLRRALVGAGVAVLAGAGLAQAQDTSTLKYKWKKGDVLHYRSVQDSDGKMTAMGMERTTKQRQEFVQRFEVKEVAEDGVATLDVSVLSVKMDLDQGDGMKGTYDTSRAADQQYDGPPRLRPTMEYYGALVGEHLMVVMDASGNVRKVEGMNKIVDKMQAKMGTVNPMVARNLRTSMGDEAMRGSMERFFKILPEKAVAAGETWTSSYEQPMPAAGGRMKLESTWTFAGSESLEGAPVAKLTSTVKADVLPPKEGEEGGVAPGMKTTIKDGKGTGLAFFDTKAGQLAKSVVDMNLPIEVAMSANGQNMTMSNNMTSKFTIERIPAPAEKKEEAPAAPAPAGQ
jgi:hypothetical protein